MEFIKNQKATWFIDPPYQIGGYKYNHNKIDYNYLLQWVKERNGQKILCENNNNTWLKNENIKEIKKINGAFKKSTEIMLYIN